MPQGHPTNYTTTMLATLQAAIATGTRSVYYGDKRVDYRSLDEMVRIQNMMLVALGLANPQGGRKFGEFHTGFGRDCFREGGGDGCCEDPNYF